MKKSKVKKFTGVILCAAMVSGMAATAFAADDTSGLNDILRIDGKTGKIYLETDEDGSNYPLKFLYDTNFWYKQDAANPDPTLGHVINFLSIGRQEEFASKPRVDLNKFVNSALGEKTAEIWYPHMLYEDQMSPGLLEYWAQKGLSKEAYWNDPDVDDGISSDYFVYMPTTAEQPHTGYPLLLLFHGGGEAAYQTETFGFCDLAAKEGIILAAAEDTGDSDSWNAIIDAVEANYPVDPARVYVVGSSGGGSNATSFSIDNLAHVAAVGVMDQPVTLSTRWYSATDENIAAMQEYTLPMVWVGGTADMYGLHGLYSQGLHQPLTTEFFETSEGNENQFISGWNQVMKAFNIEGKDITSRLDFIENPANYAEEVDGYPFDTAENIDTTGTSPLYKCTIAGTEDMCLYLVENRPHMPCGYDAENIWNFISKYSRDLETGKSIRTE